MMRPTYAVLSKGALRHNIDRVRSLAPEASLMVMVKANAYGHGLRSVARRIEPWVDALGVATLDEALRLRASGIRIPIHSMQGFFTADQLETAVLHDICPVVYRWDQLSMLVDYRPKLTARFPLWLKIQTGLNRLGFYDADLPRLKEWGMRHEAHFDVGFLTHWACADQPHSDAHQRQADRVAAVYAQVDGRFSVNNSAGLRAAPEYNSSWVRVGGAVYGVGVFDPKWRPVMTLRSHIIQRRRVEADETVGYGATHLFQEPSEIAVVTIGYGDGYPRDFLPGLSVLIHGRRCPVVGKVSMDMLVVDVSDCSDAEVGDEVLLWGEMLTVDELSEYSEMIPYQWVTGVHDRVRFFWDDSV